MNCREAEKQIFAARDRALGDTQRAALASHVAACSACRRVQDNLAAFVEGWRRESEVIRVPDASIEWRKLQRRIAGGAEPRRSRLAWFGLPSAAIAAAIVAVTFYLKPDASPQISRSPVGAPVVAASATADAPTAAATPAASTVVFVDDKSGWTFVWDGDAGKNI